MKRLPLLLTFVLTSLLAFAQTGKTEYGKASYYADYFHGKLTANGETFDMNGITAAHKYLPFNTVVRFTNLENNETILVRINDRGPYIQGRIIDLSKGAAEAINMVDDGVVKCKIEVVQTPQQYLASQQYEYVSDLGKMVGKINSIPINKTKRFSFKSNFGLKKVEFRSADRPNGYSLKIKEFDDIELLISYLADLDLYESMVYIEQTGQTTKYQILTKPEESFDKAIELQIELNEKQLTDLTLVYF